MADLDDIINLDPTTIVVTRHTKVAHAGGFSWTEADLDPQVVRVYQFNTRNQREMTLPNGEIKNIDLGVLAQVDADFVVGHDSYDTFPYGGRVCRVLGVRVYDSGDAILCTQVDCSAV